MGFSTSARLLAKNISDFNVHHSEFREAKLPQAGPSVPVPDLFRLDRRTVVITGAAGFLGLEIASTVLAAGGDVLALDVADSPPEQGWAKVTAAANTYNGEALYCTCDSTDADAVSTTYSRAASTLRHPIRGLVACAGVSDNGPSMDFPARRFRQVFEVNVTGTFLVAQAAAKHMTQAGVSGSMVLVASMSGYVSNKGVDTASYNSSKAAVQQLARSLASEWGSRIDVPLIRVNSLSPGYIRTAATVQALKKPGMEAQWTSDSMLNRLSTVDEFRAPVLFLLADGSSYMTAADLRVDGGHCAW